jgi:hypothetical protein
MKRMLILLSLAAVAGCGSWSRRAEFIQGPELRAASGRATFRKAYDDGTLIEVVVKNLAEPEALTPPGYAYVVWLQPARESKPRNLGPLVLKGSTGVLRAKTALKAFHELFVTVEASSDAAAPGGPPLLWLNREDWVDYAQEAAGR